MNKVWKQNTDLGLNTILELEYEDTEIIEKREFKRGFKRACNIIKAILNKQNCETANVCECCKQKDLLIENLYSCIEQQIGSIEMLHKELEKFKPNGKGNLFK